MSAKPWSHQRRGGGCKKRSPQTAFSPLQQIPRVKRSRDVNRRRRTQSVRYGKESMKPRANVAPRDRMGRGCVNTRVTVKRQTLFTARGIERLRRMRGVEGFRRPA